jgi:hypothetical protein
MERQLRHWPIPWKQKGVAALRATPSNFLAGDNGFVSLSSDANTRPTPSLHTRLRLATEAWTGMPHGQAQARSSAALTYGFIVRLPLCRQH